MVCCIERNPSSKLRFPLSDRAISIHPLSLDVGSRSRPAQEDTRAVGLVALRGCVDLGHVVVKLVASHERLRSSHHADWLTVQVYAWRIFHYAFPVSRSLTPD